MGKLNNSVELTADEYACISDKPYIVKTSSLSESDYGNNSKNN